MRTHVAEAEGALLESLRLTQPEAGQDRMRIHLRLAQVYQEQGKLTDAVATARTALALARDDAQRAQCLRNLGQYLPMVGELEEAARVLEQSRDLIDGVERPLAAAHNASALGHVYDRLGDPERGRAILVEALEIFRRETARYDSLQTSFDDGTEACNPLNLALRGVRDSFDRLERRYRAAADSMASPELRTFDGARRQVAMIETHYSLTDCPMPPR